MRGSGETHLSRAVENFAQFDLLANQAECAANQGDLERAYIYVQAAGFYAWRNHTGLYVSERLERITNQIGLTLPLPPPAEAIESERMIHVLTEASQVGGHTRLAWRWINNDSARKHDVIITTQRGHRIPAPLAAAVARSGGDVIVLSNESSKLSERARQLRAACSRGVVVLHTHPHDALPSIALHDHMRPVMMVNHADHVFWLGASVVDILISLRESGNQLAVSRRGFSHAACRIVPLPLDPPDPISPAERADARRAFGICPGQVVAATLASPYKFESSSSRTDWRSVHEGLLEELPQLLVLVGGPQNRGEWAECAIRTDGRLRALGQLEEPRALYAAADIYVDSTPMGSLTSMLDAALLGIPTISLNALQHPHVMSSQDPALPTSEVMFSDVDEYRRVFRQLAAEPATRRKRGLEQALAMTNSHIGASWIETLHPVFDALNTPRTSGLRARPSPDRAPVELEPVEELLIEVHDALDMAIEPWRALLEQAPLARVALRARLFRKVPSEKRLSGFPFLVSEKSLQIWRRRIANLRQPRDPTSSRKSS